MTQERLRYVPYGWTKKYEFSEVDAQCALNVIDAWVDGGASAGLTSDTPAVKKHIAPENLPWDAIRKLLLETIYGGRIDNSFDYVSDMLVCSYMLFVEYKSVFYLYFYILYFTLTLHLYLCLYI